MLSFFNKKYYWFLLFALSACQADLSEKNIEGSQKIMKVIAKVKSEYAPDKRVAVFSIEAVEKNDQIILKGETDLPEAKKALLSQLDQKAMPVIDSLTLLPDGGIGADSLGVVSISVANIRSEPKHSAELATQATMGMPLKILKKEGEWHLVQTPDKYISWIQGSFQPMNKTSFDAWQKAPKLIYTQVYGFAYNDPAFKKGTASDLVIGDIMELISESRSGYEVKFPDGRMAHVKKGEAEPFQTWLSGTETTEKNLVNTAFKFMGVPYLWGGTSSKGMDCSGFTKTIYFINGKLLPRDASQQVHAGELVDEDKNFDKLAPGDLLFFGKAATDSTRERISHVGMWIGSKEFIHAPGLPAHIQVNSIDPKAENYDEYNLNRYVRSKRIINSTNEIVNLKNEKLF